MAILSTEKDCKAEKVVKKDSSHRRKICFLISLGTTRSLRSLLAAMKGVVLVSGLLASPKLDPLDHPLQAGQTRVRVVSGGSRPFRAKINLKKLPSTYTFTGHLRTILTHLPLSATHHQGIGPMRHLLIRLISDSDPAMLQRLSRMRREILQ